MNVDHNSRVQSRKHLEIEIRNIAVDSQNMAGVDKQNVVFLKLLKKGNSTSCTSFARPWIPKIVRSLSKGCGSMQMISRG